MPASSPAAQGNSCQKNSQAAQGPRVASDTCGCAVSPWKTVLDAFSEQFDGSAKPSQAVNGHVCHHALPLAPARNRAESLRIAIATNSHHRDPLSSSALARVHAEATNSKLPIVALLHLPAAHVNAGNHSRRCARAAGRSSSGTRIQPSEIGLVPNALSACSRALPRPDWKRRVAAERANDVWGSNKSLLITVLDYSVLTSSLVLE